jgi:hypothetical protein
VEEKEKEKKKEKKKEKAAQGAGLTVRNPEPSSLANLRREAGLREYSAVVIPRLRAGRSQWPQPVVGVAPLRFL